MLLTFKRVISSALTFAIISSTCLFALNFSVSAVPGSFPEATNQELQDKGTEVGFGFYSLNNTTHATDFDEAIKSKSVNTFILDVFMDGNSNVSNSQTLIDALIAAKSNNSQIFFTIMFAIRITNPNYNMNTIPTTGNPSMLNSDWQQRLRNIDALAKSSGAYSAFAGFYIDEPFCYEDMDANPNTPGTPNASSWSEQEFIDVTKFSRETFNKKIFTVFNRISFDKEAEASYFLPAFKDTPDVSPANTMYLTDIGIDIYGNWADSAFEAGYRSSYSLFKQKLGAYNCSNLKFWHLPATESCYWTNYSEQIAINHFNGMKQMLSEESNKGGLMCYYWGEMAGAPGTVNECFKTQVTLAVSPWTTLMNLVLSTGATNCSVKTGYEAYSGRTGDYEISFGGATNTKISGASASGTLLARGSKVTNLNGIYASNVYLLNKNGADWSKITGIAVWIKSNLDLPLIEFQLRDTVGTMITNGSISPAQLGYNVIPANAGTWIYIEKSSPYVDDTAFAGFVNGATPHLNIINDNTALSGTEMIIGGIFAYEDRQSLDDNVNKLTISETYSGRPNDYEISYGGALVEKLSGTGTDGTLLGRGSKVTNINGIYASNVYKLDKYKADWSNVNGIAIWIKSNEDLPLIEFQLRDTVNSMITNGSISPAQLGYSVITANTGTWIYVEKSSTYVDDIAFESFVNGATPYFNIINNDTALSGTEMVIGGIFAYNDKTSFDNYVRSLLTYEAYSGRTSDYEVSFGGSTVTKLSGAAANGTLLSRGSRVTGLSGIYASNVYKLSKNGSYYSDVSGIAIWIKSNIDLPLIEFQLRSNVSNVITNGSISPAQLGYSVITANTGTWMYIEKSSPYVNDSAFNSFVNCSDPHINIINNNTALPGTEMTIGGIFVYNDLNSFTNYINSLPVYVSSLTLNNSTLGIYTSSTATLSATLTPSNATNQTVVWSSNNSAVATVSTSGVVTAVNPGTAVISAISADGWYTQTCTVTVSPVLVTSVTLDYSSITLGKQVTKQLTATVNPSNAYNKAVTWASNNTSVATVSSSGLVTAVAVGTATITVTTVDGGKTATCAVTVVRYDPTRYYKITYYSGSTLSMDTTTTGLNGVVKNVTYTGADSQQWQIIATTDASTFKIVNKATGYALKVNSTTNTTGKQIIQSTYVNANNMNFTIADSTTYVRLVSKLGSNTYIKSTGATGGTLLTSVTNTTTTRWVITLI